MQTTSALTLEKVRGEQGLNEEDSDSNLDSAQALGTLGDSRRIWEWVGPKMWKDKLCGSRPTLLDCEEGWIQREGVPSQTHAPAASGVVPVNATKTQSNGASESGSKVRFVAMETHGCWRRAGVALWQVAKWVGAMDDTDMCDKDAVILRLLGMASTATGAQCSVLWTRCVVRSDPVRLGCVLEKSQASRAIAQWCALNSGRNARRA